MILQTFLLEKKKIINQLQLYKRQDYPMKKRCYKRAAL
jgi:hypothetical protein